MQFWRVWESLSIWPFSVLPVTNKQFFPSEKVHRAHCSIDMLGIGSALYKTPLKRRFGTLGVKQADSSHIPQPAIAGLGFAPNGSSRPMQIKKRSISLPLCKTALPFWNLRCKSLFFSAKLRRFACKPELKDDTLTLETLWLLVTLSEEGAICYEQATAE